jgi:hypothetical protein
MVQHPLGFGIRGQQNLKATIEAEPLDEVGADPAADAVGRF